MGFAATAGGTRYVFPDVRVLLAKATPRRAGDVLAEIAASDGTERVAAQMALADLPVSRFLDQGPERDYPLTPARHRSKSAVQVG